MIEIINKEIIAFALGVTSTLVVTIIVLVLKRIINRKNNKCFQSQINYRNILDQLPVNIYWKNNDNLLLGCNKTNLHALGLRSYDEFIEKSDYDVLSKSEADQIRLVDQEVLRNKKLKVIEEVMTINGKKTLYMSHKLPLRNKNNEIIGTLGVSVDITKSKQEQLNHLKMLENIISVMPENVYWLDKSNVYLGCNDNQAKAIGLTSSQEIVGKRNIDMKGFLIPEFLDKVNKKVMETGETIVIEEPAELLDGTKATFLSSKVPLRDSNNIICGMVGISIDITERKNTLEELKKAKEEAEKASKIKSDFIKNMEHDIRTPFVGIHGMLNLLINEEINKSKKEKLLIIANSTKELLNYCNVILDFSEIESKLIPVHITCFSLKNLINKIITMQTPASKAKNINLILEYDEHLPKVILGDNYKIKCTLINLLSNAIKFTNKGHVKLIVTLSKKTDENRNIVVKFEVQDTGIGIPEDKKEYIFDRFAKISPSNKGLYKGQGLGLSVVKQFIEEMQGEIHLKSTLKKGSTFLIFLPLKVPLSNEVADPIEHEEIIQSTTT